MKEQNSIIKKNVPERLKNTSIVVPLSPLNPIIFVYTDLYYKDYLNLIYYVGRGYMFVQHIISLSRKGKTAVLKDLREMEKLSLISIEKVNKNLYVRLSRNSMIYLTQDENAKSFLPASKDDLVKIAFLSELQKEIISDEFILKKGANYRYFLWFLYETIKRQDIKELIYSELMRIEDRKIDSNKGFKDLNDLENLFDTYLLSYKVESKNIILDFAIIDINMALEAKTMLGIIKDINEFLGTITGLYTQSEKLFRINLQFYMQNLEREKLINKLLINIENKIINIDNRTYCISDFININTLSVKNLNIDRFIQ